MDITLVLEVEGSSTESFTKRSEIKHSSDGLIRQGSTKLYNKDCTDFAANGARPEDITIQSQARLFRELVDMCIMLQAGKIVQIVTAENSIRPAAAAVPELGNSRRRSRAPPTPPAELRRPRSVSARPPSSPAPPAELASAGRRAHGTGRRARSPPRPLATAPAPAPARPPRHLPPRPPRAPGPSTAAR
eukprot:XP_020406527.1 atherin-like [Zea mays]